MYLSCFHQVLQFLSTYSNRLSRLLLCEKNHKKIITYCIYSLVSGEGGFEEHKIQKMVAGVYQSMFFFFCLLSNFCESCREVKTPPNNPCLSNDQNMPTHKPCQFACYGRLLGKQIPVAFGTHKFLMKPTKFPKDQFVFMRKMQNSGLTSEIEWAWCAALGYWWRTSARSPWVRIFCF